MKIEKIEQRKDKFRVTNFTMDLDQEAGNPKKIIISEYWLLCAKEGCIQTAVRDYCEKHLQDIQILKDSLAFDEIAIETFNEMFGEKDQ